MTNTPEPGKPCPTCGTVIAAPQERDETPAIGTADFARSTPGDRYRAQKKSGESVEAARAARAARRGGR